jgi:hypothetical protein
MTFYGILPDEISESHNANFAAMDIMSRSGQLWSYSGGDSRTISLNFDVHEDYLAAFNGGKADIREFAAKFKALTYPEYTESGVIPPSLLLRVGSFIKFKGICRSATVTWRKPMRNNRYIVANFSLDMAEANKLAFAASEIVAMDDLRRV